MTRHKRGAPSAGARAELLALEGRIARLERAVFGWTQGGDPAGADSPAARTTADLVTPRQLANIRRLARLAGVDADAECVRLHGFDVGSLSKNGADAFLKHLQKLAHLRAGEVRG